MMIGVIVLFPKIEEAKGIRNLLVRNGIDVIATCTTGAQAIVAAEGVDDGVIICGYKYSDMQYMELRDYLPETIEMLLVASKTHFPDCNTSEVVCLSMPIKSYDLLNTVNLLMEGVARKRKKRKEQPKVRTDSEKAVIESAKLALMEQNGMTEAEAHKYLQKRSMDSGMNLVETAHAILDLF